MKAVVSRVGRASVSVDGVVIGKIDEPGLLVLLGMRRVRHRLASEHQAR